MFVKKKKNRSGRTSVVVAEKLRGSYRELVTVGVTDDEEEMERSWPRGASGSTGNRRGYLRLDLFDDNCEARRRERKQAERALANVSNVLINGADLILAKTVTTVQFELPLGKDVISRTMLLPRHAKIAKLFDPDFWGMQ